MTTSTARQQFRETVAEVAAKAKAALPQEVNGRVESAVKLVLQGDVEPQADGSIHVGSSSDPAKTYHLVGQACTCQDFLHDKAPQGWCQHRIAAGIRKRVTELLPHEPDQAPVPAPVALGEAPASCNVYVTISGHKVQVTLRDSDESRMLARLQTLLAQYPAPQPAAPTTGEGWCAHHSAQMTLRPGKGGRPSFYSHKSHEGWCHGAGGRP